MAEQVLVKEQKKENVLDVGVVIFIQIKGSQKSIRYKSSIVGWKFNHLIIIDMPILNGSYVNLSDGSTCIVRYIYCGNAYGFETKIIKNVNDARLPLIYISYPKSVEKISLRKYERTQTLIPARIEVLLDDKIQTIEGSILDLSVGGCLLDIDNHKKVELDVETKIKLYFTLANTGEQLEAIPAIIKRIQKVRNKTMSGAQFIDLSSDTLEKISRFCESCKLTN